MHGIFQYMNIHKLSSDKTDDFFFSLSPNNFLYWIFKKIYMYYGHTCCTVLVHLFVLSFDVSRVTSIWQVDFLLEIWYAIINWILKFMEYKYISTAYFICEYPICNFDFYMYQLLFFMRKCDNNICYYLFILISLISIITFFSLAWMLFLFLITDYLSWYY